MTGRWEPLSSWQTEQPQRCTVCGDVLSGRELGYLPVMCERENCPPLPERKTVTVRPEDDTP